MAIIKGRYSDFGSCYFMEVSGFVPDPKNIYVKLKTAAENFDWAV